MSPSQSMRISMRVYVIGARAHVYVCENEAGEDRYDNDLDLRAKCIC